MISLDFSENYSRKTKEFLDKVSHDPSVLTHINQIIGANVNQFVPMRSGVLRGSMYADAEGVHWSTPYAHYQYVGQVYEVNKPIYSRGRIIGWYSPPGMSKVPSGRELGIPGELDGWVFGYTTPGTQHHWDEVYTANQWKTGRSGVKAKINSDITRYVKRVAGMFWAFNNG